MIYTVKCCALPNIATVFYPFPTGCRVGGGALTRRENLVHIPFADGTKDIGDGTLEGGDVTVEGRIWASSGQAAIALVATMENTLYGFGAPFYICQDYGSGYKFYPVHGCKSVSHTIPDGPGGVWIDIACVFSRGPDPAMIAA